MGHTVGAQQVGTGEMTVVPGPGILGLDSPCLQSGSSLARGGVRVGTNAWEIPASLPSPFLNATWEHPLPPCGVTGAYVVL